MRKNVIALMLILPILLVFVLFSSGQVASLNVFISVNGIEILQEFENDTIYLDLAEYNGDISIDAQVKPINASNKKYRFNIQQVEGADFADVSVQDGRIVANSLGMAEITAISNDGGYTDSVTVVVGSSKPFNFDVSLFSQTDEKQNLNYAQNVYSGTISTGEYKYLTNIVPTGFVGAELEVLQGDAIVDEKAKTINFPFSGNVKIKFTVSEGVNGDIEKIIDLNVLKQETSTGFTINGGANEVIGLEKDALVSSFFVEADHLPEVVSVSKVDISNVQIENIGLNKYKIDVTFAPGHDKSRVTLKIKVNNALENVIFSFLDFDFVVKNELPNFESSNVALTINSPVKFYAVPTVEKEGVSYKWWVRDAQNEDASSSFEIDLQTDNADICSLTPKEYGSFKLYVQAYYNDRVMDVYVAEINIEVLKKFTEVQILNKISDGLSKRIMVGGLKLNGQNETEKNEYAINVVCYNAGVTETDLSFFDVSCSSNDLAELKIENNNVLLTPLGKGEVTISIAWKGNSYYNSNVKASLTVGVDGEAVEVGSSKQLFEQTRAGNPIVLTANIMLDVDKPNPTTADYKAMLGTMQSTYNTEYYKNLGRINEAKVNFVVEFKNNVYGNGFWINAEKFTNKKDQSGVAELFTGPLKFVQAGELASVAGQDNIAFLMRTDDVTLFNVELLGCSDESLQSETDANKNDLTNLNNVGTTLDINASVNLVNCRVRNGRNVIRVYGGNKNGDSYFVEELNADKTVENEKINVNIKGCRIAQAREFLLKIGANKALRAVNEAEPNLINVNTNEVYNPQTNDYITDEYFVSHYVLTDVNLEDSVLETSGLFAVGIESNFSGQILYQTGFAGLNDGWFKDDSKGWNAVAGTSFASILHLKGDVRIYDWKELARMDSSTLIECNDNIPILKLNIAAMLNCVKENKPDQFGDIMFNRNGTDYVHAGIAFYGGGKNYSQLDISQLNDELTDLTQYNINISELASSTDTDIKNQGQILPIAAGTQDFRFFLYSANSANSLNKQETDDRNLALSQFSPFTLKKLGD